MIARLRRLSISSNGAAKDSLAMVAVSSVVEKNGVLRVNDPTTARERDAGLRKADELRRRQENSVDRQQ